MRKHGLTIDQLLSVDVVTAEGEFVTADEEQNADLFWGVRGGGGNFGIVTEFEFRLNPLGPEVMAGPVLWAMEDAPEVLRFYRVLDRRLPRRAHDDRRPAPGAGAPGRAPELVGKLVVAVALCHAGPVEDGQRVVRPLKECGSPILDLCRPSPISPTSRCSTPPSATGGGTTSARATSPS